MGDHGGLNRVVCSAVDLVVPLRTLKWRNTALRADTRGGHYKNELQLFAICCMIMIISTNNIQSIIKAQNSVPRKQLEAQGGRGSS